jgi:hypothetical protein
MKIARLLMLLLALSATVLSATRLPSKTPVRKGGGIHHAHSQKGGPRNQKATEYEWWCNDGSDGGPCSGMYECMDLCMEHCGPPCTWYGDAT